MLPIGAIARDDGDDTSISGADSKMRSTSETFQGHSF